MDNINMVMATGRLTKDSEVKATSNGKTVLTFYIAINERIKKGDKWEDYPNFIKVNHWTSIADKMQPSLTKGKSVTVAGSLRQNRWESKGQNESEIYILATKVEYTPAGDSKSAPQEEHTPGPESFDDDIPF